MLLPKIFFERFKILLTAIFSENVDGKEMILGLKIDIKEDKYQKALRNFLTFTIRSIIRSNKWTNFCDMNIQVIPDRGNRQKRRRLLKSYLLEFERVKYQISYRAFEVSCWKAD